MLIIYDTVEEVFIKAKWPTLFGTRLGKTFLIYGLMVGGSGRYEIHSMDGELIY